MIREIIAGEDIHMNNSLAIFRDKEHRQESKVISFRSLYGGSAYAFFMDPQMPSFTQAKWEEIFNAFCAKYSRLIAWQDENFKLVRQQGWLQTFTGRKYIFHKHQKNDGTWDYSRPSVCNYPVQGTATADIVPLVMCQIRKKIIKLDLQEKVHIINQVHDSIVFDTQKKYVDTIIEICYHYFQAIPESVQKYFGYNWTVPMTGDIKVGVDWKTMEKIKL